MTMTESKEVQKIQAQYMPVERTKMDELKSLDKKVRRPAEVFAYLFGCVGALVLGTGMCLAMKVIGNLMPLGIVIGLAGIAMVSANYFLYEKLLKGRKRKYAQQIFTLSNEILNK